MNPQNSQEADTAQNLKKKNYTKGEKLGLCLTYTFSFEKKKIKTTTKPNKTPKPISVLNTRHLQCPSTALFKVCGRLKSGDDYPVLDLKSMAVEAGS